MTSPQDGAVGPEAHWGCRNLQGGRSGRKGAEEGDALGLGFHLHARPVLEQRGQGLALMCCVFCFVQLSLGHLAFLWELGFPTCKMSMSPTPGLGESLRSGPAATEHLGPCLSDCWCCYPPSAHRTLPFAHLQNRMGLLIRKLSESETGLEATSPISAPGVLLLHRDGLQAPPQEG